MHIAITLKINVNLMNSVLTYIVFLILNLKIIKLLKIIEKCL